MAENIKSTGKCYSCGNIFTKKEIKNHLNKCFKTNPIIPDNATKSELFFRIFIEGYKIFWLDIDEDGLLPFLNSPRSGEYGYCDSKYDEI